jgi:hypothetical protein
MPAALRKHIVPWRLAISSGRRIGICDIAEPNQWLSALLSDAMMIADLGKESTADLRVRCGPRWQRSARAGSHFCDLIARKQSAPNSVSSSQNAVEWCPVIHIE